MDDLGCVNVFLSEGSGVKDIVKQMEDNGEEVPRDAFGHVKLDKINPGAYFANKLSMGLGAEKTLVQKSGYFARSAAANAFDQELIGKCAEVGVDAAINGVSGCMGQDEDKEGMRFYKGVDPEGDAATQCIINSTELRAASSTPFDNGLHFTMTAEVETPIQPAFKPTPPQVTPAVTRSGRTAAVVELAPPPPPPDDTVYVISAKVDQQIRMGCWLGGKYGICDVQKVQAGRAGRPSV